MLTAGKWTSSALAASGLAPAQRLMRTLEGGHGWRSSTTCCRERAPGQWRSGSHWVLSSKAMACGPLLFPGLGGKEGEYLEPGQEHVCNLYDFRELGVGKYFEWQVLQIVTAKSWSALT